jgi:transcriptional regulator with XRE-family HTH domain
MFKNIADREKFSDRFRNLRRQLGLSQRELAEKLGFTGNTQVSKFEKSTTEPTLEMLRRLFSACSSQNYPLNLHWLITGEPSPDAKRWREDCLGVVGTTLMFIDLLNQRIDEDRGNLVQKVHKFRMQESQGALFDQGTFPELNAQIADLERQLAQNRQTRDQIIERIYGKSKDQSG